MSEIEKKCRFCTFFIQNVDVIMDFVDCGELNEDECYERVEKAVKKGYGFCVIDFEWKKEDDEACEFFNPIDQPC